MERKKAVAIGAGLGMAGLTFGLIAIAQAATDTPSPSASATATHGHHGETPLTGSDAEKATAAAKAAVPDGTVLRVETDSEGVYEAHVRKPDGSEVVVKMDANFTVTGVEAFTHHGRHGHHGHHGETPLTGSDAEKATAAAKAAVPDGTVLRVETDSEGVYEAHVRKPDGSEVVVKMDANFTVTGVEAFTHHGRHGHHGHSGSTDGSTPSPATLSSQVAFL